MRVRQEAMWYILNWRADRVWLVGPFGTGEQADAWARDPASNPEGDQRWRIIELVDPFEAVRIVSPATAKRETARISVWHWRNDRFLLAGPIKHIKEVVEWGRDPANSPTYRRRQSVEFLNPAPTMVILYPWGKLETTMLYNLNWRNGLLWLVGPFDNPEQAAQWRNYPGANTCDDSFRIVVNLANPSVPARIVSPCMAKHATARVFILDFRGAPFSLVGPLATSWHAGEWADDPANNRANDPDGDPTWGLKDITNRAAPLKMFSRHEVW
jgi:hypothetical protein